MVKLIDVYPENAQKNDWKPEADRAQGIRAVAERLRTTDRDGSAPRPLPGQLRAAACRSCADKPIEWNIPLRDHDHVFLKGHRIMVQVQSTWFPVIDRNPQKFVPSIYKASASDYVPATQRVYCSPTMPSHIELPIAQ